MPQKMEIIPVAAATDLCLDAYSNKKYRYIIYRVSADQTV